MVNWSNDLVTTQIYAILSPTSGKKRNDTVSSIRTDRTERLVMCWECCCWDRTTYVPVCVLAAVSRGCPGQWLWCCKMSLLRCYLRLCAINDDVTPVTHIILSARLFRKTHWWRHVMWKWLTVTQRHLTSSQPLRIMCAQMSNILFETVLTYDAVLIFIWDVHVACWQ